MVEAFDWPRDHVDAELRCWLLFRTCDSCVARDSMVRLYMYSGFDAFVYNYKKERFLEPIHVVIGADQTFGITHMVQSVIFIFFIL